MTILDYPKKEKSMTEEMDLRYYLQHKKTKTVILTRRSCTKRI
jgi:hypothetical protein